MLRPADVRLHMSHDGHGVVVSRYFRGSENAYDVRLPSGAIVRCSVPGLHPLQPGTRVCIEPVCERAVVFPVDGDAEIRDQSSEIGNQRSDIEYRMSQ
jgi:hypothetical protein